jgi:hypothetical protein
MAELCKFDFDHLDITLAARQVLEEADCDPTSFVIRHLSGDAGSADTAFTSRLFSEFRLRSGRRIWIVTKSADSACVVCLPEEQLNS